MGSGRRLFVYFGEDSLGDRGDYEAGNWGFSSLAGNDKMTGSN